jgi:putative ABC transport system ATP-binding protein
MPDNLPPEFLSLSSLSKAYREGSTQHQVLENASLCLQRGEICALLGKSGSGKSTLLNLIAGIDLPDSGEVRVNGVCLSQLSEHERTLFRRRHIGFVFQSFNLIPTLKVRENLELALELNGIRDRTPVDLLLARLGLGDRKESFPDRLSGGEQQRVAIARALIHRPSLILADEPTGNLDARTGEEVLALLQELIKEFEATLLIATHSTDVLAIAQRILRVEEGKLIESRETDQTVEKARVVG